MSEFDDSRSDEADKSGGEIESLTSVFQEPVPSPLDDLPPASYWPDGALPQRQKAEEEIPPGVAADVTGDMETRPRRETLDPTAPVEQVAPVSPPSTGSAPPFQRPEPWIAERSQRGPSRARWIVAGVVVLSALGLGGCGYLFFRTLAQPPIDRANELLADITDENFAGAAERVSTSADCFGATPATGLESLFGPNPVDDYNFTFVSVDSSLGEQTSAVVEGIIDFRPGGESLSGGGPRPAQIILVKVGDQWDVCGISIG